MPRTRDAPDAMLWLSVAEKRYMPDRSGRRSSLTARAAVRRLDAGIRSEAAKCVHPPSSWADVESRQTALGHATAAALASEVWDAAQWEPQFSVCGPPSFLLPFAALLIDRGDETGKKGHGSMGLTCSKDSFGLAEMPGCRHGLVLSRNEPHLD